MHLALVASAKPQFLEYMKHQGCRDEGTAASGPTVSAGGFNSKGSSYFLSRRLSQ